MKKLIFFIINATICISMITCDKNISIGKNENQILVWQQFNYKRETERRCFFDFKSMEFIECESVKDIYNDIPPNNTKYKYYYELITKKKNNGDKVQNEISNIIKKSCDDNYLLYQSDHRFYSPNGNPVPLLYERNSYYDYLYYVSSKKKYDCKVISNYECREVILCGKRNEKYEVVLKGDFSSFFSTPKGKFILVDKKIYKDKYQLFSLDPETKIQKILLNLPEHYSIVHFNEFQSLIVINGLDVLIYDHNKNKIKEIGKFPKEIVLNPIFREVESIKDKYMIFKVSDSEKKAPRYLIVFDFQKNKIKPEIKVKILEDCTAFEMVAASEPFVYEMN